MSYILHTVLVNSVLSYLSEWWPGQESESKSAHEQHEGVHLARLPLSPLRDRRGLSASHSSDEFNLAWPRRESRIGGGFQPLYLLFLLGSLWDHFAPGVPHQGPWCTSPGQWLSWPKGDGVKCSRSERPRRESRNEINETRQGGATRHVPHGCLK